MIHNIDKGKVAALMLAAMALLGAQHAVAHCDSIDGPVVREAQEALESGDVTPVLKWVAASDESLIEEAFSHALAVRALGPEAQQLADRHFFETLVRLHRASEGEPFTGLLPEGTPLEPGVAEAEEALHADSADALVEEMSEMVSDGLRERFNHVLEAREQSDESVEAGRAYVAAYVEYIHYVRRLYRDSATSAAHHSPAGDHDAHGSTDSHADDSAH